MDGWIRAVIILSAGLWLVAGALACRIMAGY